jgi:hypothetical protein
MGHVAGVGLYDGRSNGGAVSRRAIFRKVERIFLPAALALVLAAGLASCSRQKAEATPDAATLLQSVAPADPAKLSALEEGKHWGNPYLVIRPDAVGMLTGVDAVEEKILKPEEVLTDLAHLPPAAWPYGRAVAVLVDAKPTSSEPDKIALRRNRGIVAGELQSAHVAIHWIPSS